MKIEKMKKTKFFLVILVFIMTVLIIYIASKQSNLKIITNGAGFETAFITWKENSNYNEKYNVYIKKAEENEYKKIDNELVRNCNDSCFRADAIGLEEGNYKFKIVPLINNIEDESRIIESKPIQVTKNIREGFSFSKNSPNEGNSSGGYLENGLVPEDAKILYITSENANTVTLDITTSDGNIKKLTGICEILQKWNEESISKHLIIRIIGKLEKENIKGLHEKYNSIQIKNCNGVTIEGVGNDATLKGIGIIVEQSTNIEIRNLGIMLYHEDAFCLERENKNIWIHNNDVFYGEDTGGDQEKGDGSIDIKQSEYITISYNHFWDTGKTSVCGIRNDLNYITYHHNWFDHCDSRCPRASFASVHCYNNYYDGNSKYSVIALDGASVFLESNYFRTCRYPMIISNQGSEYLNRVIEEKEGGIIKSYNNMVVGKKNSLIYSSEDSIQFDAYIVDNRTDIVPQTYKTLSGNYTYNNFDTDKNIMYKYKPNNIYEVKEIVTNRAGRLQGGNIKFDTSKLDDKSYKRTDIVEQELDNIIKDY